MPCISSARLLWPVCLAFLLVLSACSQNSSPSSTSSAPSVAPPGSAGPAAAPQPKRGGVYTLSAGIASYGGTDPAMGQQSYNVWPVIGEYLLRAESETWKLMPAAIERWDVSPDGLTMTLHLRKGVKLHDKPPVNGRELEARDVVYTLKTITGQLYPQLPTVRFPRRSQYEQMKDAEAIDRHTVKVTLTEPSSTFLEGLAEYRAAVVVPDGLREAFGGADALALPDVNRYISAGPFVLTKFNNTVEVEYDRHPAYYEQALDGKTKPYLDKVRFIWIADKGTENAAFIAGQIDVLAFTNNQDRELVTSQRKDIKILTYGPSSCWYRVAFNLARKPFDDLRVRKAFALALDPVEAGNQFFGEWEGKPLWRYPGPLPWVFPQAIPQEELARLPGYRLPKDQDLAEARRLMAEAGFPDGFEFEMLTTTTQSGEYAQLAQNQLRKALGVRISLKRVDNAINLELAAKGDFHAQYYCYIHEATAVAMMKTPYHTKGGRNFPHFSDAMMDNLLDQAGRELDLDKQTQLLRQAQARALDLLPFIPTLHYAAQVALQPYVRDARYGAATDRQVWFKDLWLDK